LLQAKLASLQDLVHSAITEAAQQQKLYYDKHSHVHSFVSGDLVWLSNPRSGKLQPKWLGKWRILWWTKHQGCSCEQTAASQATSI